ncbi:MAG: ABC transporter substrate-binding protein, partial [Desulfuromonadales bacterium]|nr:ABC transporter substrate-binding protein [Desulfuromonadales bacterium]
LPGANEYHDRLDVRLHEVLLGTLTPEEAMEKAAEDWDEVTDDEDRDSQIKFWSEQK